MIIQAFKSEFTGQLFEFEEDYKQHIKKKKAELVRDKKRRSKEEYFKQWLADNFTHNVKTFAQLEAAVAYHTTELGVIFAKNYKDVFGRKLVDRAPIEITKFSIEPTASFVSQQFSIRFIVKFQCKISKAQAASYAVSDFCEFIGLDTGTGGLASSSGVADGNGKILHSYQYEGYATGRRGNYISIEQSVNELLLKEKEDYTRQLFEYELGCGDYPKFVDTIKVAFRNEELYKGEHYTPAYKFDMAFS